MKNFIKNNLKVFVAVIISGIIFTGIGVYAASQYFAKDISFTPTNENFKKENGESINNVEDALNELFLSQSKTKIQLQFHAKNSLSYGWTGNKLTPLLYQANNSLYFSTKASNYGVGTIYYEIDNIEKYSGFKIKINGNGKSFLAGISTNVNDGYGIIDYTKMDLDYSDSLKDFNVDRIISTSNLKQSDKYYIVFMSNQCDGVASIEPILK